MSEPDENRQNQSRWGTEHDKLLTVQPHTQFITPEKPQRNSSRWENSGDQSKNKHDTVAKPTKWSLHRKERFWKRTWLSYNMVLISLMAESYLASYRCIASLHGQFLYQPKALQGPAQLKLWCLWNIKGQQKDCPRDATKALTMKSCRRNFRWIRDGPLVFVKWKDTQTISVYSTIHAAYSGHVSWDVSSIGRVVGKYRWLLASAEHAGIPLFLLHCIFSFFGQLSSSNYLKLLWNYFALAVHLLIACK